MTYLHWEENVNSEILNYMGLGGLDVGYIFIGMLVIIVQIKQRLYNGLNNLYN